MKYLKQILFQLRKYTYKELFEKMTSDRTIFLQCLSNPEMEFRDLLKQLFAGFGNLKKQYYLYIKMNIQRMHDFICNFCDSSITNQFLFDSERRKYILVVKFPEQVQEFKDYLKQFDQFVPLIALGNLINCMIKKTVYQIPSVKDLSFSFEDTIGELDFMSEKNILNNENKLEGFQDYFFPGLVWVPQFYRTVSAFRKFFNDKEPTSYQTNSNILEFLVNEYSLLKPNSDSLLPEVNNANTHILYSFIQGFNVQRHKFFGQKILDIDNGSFLRKVTLVLFLLLTN